MLSGLMGAIGEVDEGNRSRAIRQGQYFRLSIVPLATIDAPLLERLQEMADNNPALMQPGATVTTDSGRVRIAGLAAMDWERVGDFIDSLGQVVAASAPYNVSTVEADIYDELTLPSPEPGPTPTPTPTPTPGPPATGGPTPTVASPTLFGIPVLYLAIGAGVLWFMNANAKGK